MFTVYIDDSGTDPSQHVAIATAMIVPAYQVERLDSEWETLRKKEHFSDFHTSEFIAKNERSDFAKWGDDKQKRVFRRVREITKKYGLAAYSFAVCKADYNEVVPNDHKKYFGTYHYTWAVRHMIKFTDEWRFAHGNKPFEYVFDSMGRPGEESRREVENAMQQAEDFAELRGLPGGYKNFSLRSRKDIPALQCTDVVAWTCYQKALLVFRRTPMKELAEIAWNDFLFHQGENKWLVAATITKDNLKTWTSQEIADGRSIKLFNEWEEKYGKKK